MKYHRQWIEDTFPPLYVPRGKWKHRVPPQVNFSDTDSIDTNMTKALMSNATVLLSNEGFVLKNGSEFIVRNYTAVGVAAISGTMLAFAA